jgi:hypothetical protein
MNFKLLLLYSTYTFSSFAQESVSDKASTHGMLLFGTEKIYASHLPMFHSPHDYQIIIELELESKAKQSYLDERKLNENELVYTIEPETFVLPDRIKVANKFLAAIYSGHFERGGKKIMSDAELIIKRIIYFNKFNSNNKRPDSLNYLLFGNAKEQFLAHLICKKPDFDEISSIKILTKSAQNYLLKLPFLKIQIAQKDTRESFNNTITKAFDLRSKTEIVFEQRKIIYLEFSDLE